MESTQEKLLKNIKDLENLMSLLIAMDLPNYEKGRLIKEIDLTIDIMKADLIKHLGKESYAKLLKEKK